MAWWQFTGATMFKDDSVHDYVTPLPGAFADLLQTALNEQLDDTAELHKLAERVLALELKGTGLTLFFQQKNGQLVVSTEAPAEVSTWIRGTPKALFGMAKPEWSSSNDQVNIEGDAGLVRDFEAIIRNLDFDWEQKLSSFVGDVAAHQIGVIARKVAGFAKNAIDLGRDSGKDAVAKVARAQAEQFTSAAEFSEFSAKVTSLSAAVTELENRLGKVGSVVKGK